MSSPVSPPLAGDRSHPIAVVAIGGNSLISDKKHQAVPHQWDAVRETSRQIVDMIAEGWTVVVTHGNGFVHGYPIARVERRGEKTLIVLAQDHGLQIAGNTTREVYFPRREIKGMNAFVIPTATTMVLNP